ncbi:MAG: XRE family transcriptional regulator [Candidatus Competibacteraceae bacterium]|nr:MAG: XRE family transcriptional regulator [Candidatus Competibacteraceae bacterium]
MPAPSPVVIDVAAQKLESLGQQIRAHRKALRVSATAAAEAAGMSRVTLYRIEHGEPAVTIGAYLNAMAVLGLDFGIVTPPNPASDVSDDHRKGWIPARIRLSDYPQLKQLAWQVHGTDELTPVEALDIYERNGRHLDFTTMEPRERHLIDALRLAFGEGGIHV